MDTKDNGKSILISLCRSQNFSTVDTDNRDTVILETVPMPEIVTVLLVGDTRTG